MASLQDLSIRSKVALAFGLVLAVTLALGLFALAQLNTVHERAADVRETWFPANRALGEYAFETMRVRQMQAAAIAAPPDVSTAEEQLLSKIIGDALKAWQRYERSLASDEARHLAELIRIGWENYLVFDARLREMRLSGRDEAGVYAFYTGEMRRAYAEWREVLLQAMELQTQEGDRAFRQGEQAFVAGRAWILGAIGLAVVASALAGFFIVTSVSRPIRRLTHTIGRLAGKDLAVAVGETARQDEIGAIARAVAVFKQGLIERERLAAELERQARLDPLTGVLNRRAFDELLRRDVARAQRHNRPLAVVLIDIDYFKQLNDTMGHAVGDKVLVALARAVSAGLRAEDLFCRYGGEEFIVALAETDRAGAAAAAERLRAAIAAIAVEHEGVPCHVTASFGVASFGDPARDTIDGVIHAADLALYRAKAMGRNRVVCADAMLPPKAATA